MNCYQPWAGAEEGHAVTITFRVLIAGSPENETAARLLTEVPQLQRSGLRGHLPMAPWADLARGQLFPGATGACFVCTG